MARRFDFTRFITTTAVTVTSFDLEKMEAFKDTMYIDGEPTTEQIQKEITKKYGKAKIDSVMTFGIMYGLTNEQVMAYGEQLNPYTRQPWDENLSSTDKADITMQYCKEQAEKKAQQ